MDESVELTEWDRVTLIVTHLVKKFPACVLWGFPVTTNTNATVRSIHTLTRADVFHQLTATANCQLRLAMSL
jgi:hypothetical protein